MGCGASHHNRVNPGPEPGASQPESLTICGQCGLDGHQKVATWWCEDCEKYICNFCAYNHGNLASTRSHYLIRAEAKPTPKPKRPKPAWERTLQSKQAVLKTFFDTRAELHYVDIHNVDRWNQQEGEEHTRGECLLPMCNVMCCPKRHVTQAAAIITGCTYLPGGYIAVSDYLNEQIKLFDTKFRCNSYIHLDGSKPTDICSHSSQIYIAIDEKAKIEKVEISLPYLCFGRKLSRNGVIKTDGYCDSIGICRRSSFTHALVAGITYPQGYETKRYQVHIISFSGDTLIKMFYDDIGKTLFHGKLFVSGTPRKGEIIVSDSVAGTLQGFNFAKKNGEGLFRHDISAPLGLSVDQKNNIYVISHGCFFWIPAHRETVVTFLRRGHRSKSTNCCYDDRTETLAVTSSHSETVQLYKII